MFESSGGRREMVHGRILEIRHKGGGLRRNQAIRQAPPAKSLSPRCATTTGCQLGSWLLASMITASPAWILSYNWTMQYTCSYARLGSYGAFCRRRPEFFRLTPSQSSVDLPPVRIPTTYLIGCNLISIQEQCLLHSHDLHDVVRPWGRPSPVLAYPY